MSILPKERALLRELAKQQVELAHSDAMQRLRRDWEKHGRFDPDSRPMITVELWTMAEEVLPSLMQCETEEARALEWMMRSNTANTLLFGDDTIVKDYLPVEHDGWFVPFGLPVQKEFSGEAGLGHHFIPQLFDLEEDFGKLKKSEFGLDLQATQRKLDYLRDIFDDSIDVKLSGRCFVSCLTQDIVHLMSMEDMFFAMCDAPEQFGRMMANLAQDYSEWFAMFEAAGAVLPSCNEVHLNQGSYCYNAVLPSAGTALRREDVWLYMDSQETSGISPEMYRTLIFPYYQQLSQHFGRLSYGCCEATDPIWDDCLSKLPNLGKVSISPWCNEAFMGERLRGKQIVYLRKPSPNFLGVGSTLDEDGLRAHMDKTVAAAQGCTLEIAQRDVYKLGNTPDKVRRYVEIVRSCCDRHRNV